jgi:hypothetical protein
MTGDGSDGERLTFLGRDVPSAFALQSVTIAAGASLAFDETQWDDALVILEAGALEVECHSGRRRRFAPGAVMVLAGLDLRTLHSVGPDAALLVAVSRRRRPGPA